MGAIAELVERMIRDGKKGREIVAAVALAEDAEPKTAKRKTTPREELEQVLDKDHADAVLEHRQRIRKPMTARAAKLLAGKFSGYHDPNAAADAMIVRGWQGFEPEWMEQSGGSARASPAPLRGLAAVQDRIRRDIENEQRSSGAGSSNLANDGGLGVRTIEHH